ncbi:glucooligosaccharide oxidase [Moniliophthora roreri MCA 2997]|uniref:Glucooligosaccharide oxidase n=1 Tax=Moniliophthora roreri (strain MCA 2997) TaxID=1381753 RepID=V2X562_MONRO|nr:glucooligosaccharide oxidase [Moniliophthora roreri MCA 2997]
MRRVLLSFLHFAALFCSTLGGLPDDLQEGGVSALYPGDPGYEAASQAFNQRYSFQPAAIAFPTSSEQVSIAIRAGAMHNLKVVARSGGHNYIANGLGGKDGSLVLDLSKLKKISYDTESQSAVIEPGNRLGDIALALNEYGRAIPHGRCSYVGVGGHAAGGGFGFVSRMWGLNLDAVQSVEAVLANGTIVTASSTENSDLFWGLRGSASSFAIVTSLNFRTFPVPTSATIFRYSWSFDVDAATNALYKFQSFVESDIPRELGGELVLTQGPSAGQLNVQFFGGYWGPLNTFNQTVAPYLQVLPEPSDRSIDSGNWLEGLEALLYGALNTSTAPDPLDTFYAKSVLTPKDEPLTEEATRTFIAYLANEGFASETSWFVEVELYGGSNSAISAVPVDDTAFVHRDTRFNFQLYASSPNAQPPYPESGFTFVDGMASSIISQMPEHWNWGAYINYPDDRLDDWEKLYFGSHWERLRSLKQSVDPSNVLSYPLSV